MSGISLHIEEKIVPWSFFQENDVKLHNHKIVFTNGCFDVLHFGHVQYLLEAKKLGDLLVVGLNSDASVRRLKGESRPINGEKERAFVLAALAFVDYVVVFEEDTPKELIEVVKPNVLVKGGDYKIENIVGADFVMQNGGTVTTIPFVEGFSSTHIIEQLKH
ncbi:MAG: D-glycero-beta-D-manno-heptose 1-phosphate adenylyltransferase [Bacteroidales bacterium]|jgi:D-beta-D-heptose 7-phosphate kinase/D-beta-D-heptose 1-phosphate adenosyltransferase|nr:D-glycero-beta-D-manno-heptose 1-phosphate adenylyltransferase [Bacteroidales bacterium]